MSALARYLIEPQGADDRRPIGTGILALLLLSPVNAAKLRVLAGENEPLSSLRAIWIGALLRQFVGVAQRNHYPLIFVIVSVRGTWSGKDVVAADAVRVLPVAFESGEVVMEP